MENEKKPPPHEKISTELILRIEAAMRAYLEVRFNHLLPEHRAIASAAMESLFSRLNEFHDLAPNEDQLVRLALTIVKRRALDQIRARTLYRAHVRLDEANLSRAFSADDPERTSHYVSLIKKVLQQISAMPESDQRLLLWREQQGLDTSMTAAERKQLSRLRVKLQRLLSLDSGEIS